jgi:hypothetical protein
MEQIQPGIVATPTDQITQSSEQSQGMGGNIAPGQEQPQPSPAAEPIEQPQDDGSDIEEKKKLEQVLTQEEMAQIEAYGDNADIMIFGEKSQPAILQELQQGKSPIDGIAKTANHLHKMLVKGLADKGEQMTDKTLFIGGSHLVSELTVLADGAGLYDLDNKQRLDALQLTMKYYFEEGINSGQIDPVELQKSVEPLMTPEQKQYGLMNMQKLGISKTAPPSGKMWMRPKDHQQQPQATQPAPSGTGAVGIVGQGGI